VLYSCMVHIKFTARPRSPIVSPKFGLMCLDDALKVSAEQKETSTEQLEDSLGGQQVVTSTDVSLSWEATSDHESQSRGSEDSESGSDTAMRLKAAAAPALAGVTYDFVQSTMTKTCLVSLGKHGHYFPRVMVGPLARALCLSLGRTKLSYSRISLPLGFSFPHIWFFWTFCVSFEYNYIS
jgi:hypothetical protein